jgi:hypothetical protein
MANQADSLTKERQLCKESTSLDGWLWMLCKKPAKFKVTLANGRAIFRCGIHARRFKKGQLAKVEPL